MDPLGYGVATSAFQIEGATDVDGRGDSVWDVFCRQPGRILDGSDGTVACDSYHRQDEDLALLEQLGVSSYRFSVAWPRVQPTGRGPANAAGLDHYERLVDAYETRRILDRLYGYEVSPVLWRKVMQGLSAGRVQSVATRLVVERERERMAFVAADYWDIVATFDPGAFTARLASVDGKRVAQGRDFDRDGTLRSPDAVQLPENDVRELVGLTM